LAPLCQTGHRTPGQTTPGTRSNRPTWSESAFANFGCQQIFFKKRENLFFPPLSFHCLLRGPSLEVRSCPSSFVARSSDYPRVPQPASRSGPARPSPPATADGRVPPVIPDLGSEFDRGRDPDPESPLRAPLVAGPHA
jgi:hypothetical protein